MDLLNGRGEAREVVAQINKALRVLGIVPNVTLQTKVDIGITTFSVNVCYRDAFKRRTYNYTAESTSDPDYAYNYALQEFYRHIMKDITYREQTA